jgi:hypothetical protein
MPSTRLHLLIPGLLGPLPDQAPPPSRPSLSALEILLSRGDPEPFAGTDAVDILMRLFGYPATSGRDWPSAALSRLGEGAAADRDWWLHADPVHLRPDMDRLLLFDARLLEVGMAEAQSLARLIEGHFEHLGLRIETPAPNRWYLSVSEVPDLVTRPLHEVVGRNVWPFLPRGGAARIWRGVLNELQMLLFQAPENRRRAELGRPQINGLWLWGGGRLPIPAGDCPWRQVIADAPLPLGLARQAGVTVLSWHADPLGQGLEGDCLGLRQDLVAPLWDADVWSWTAALESLEPLLAALLARLTNRAIDGLWVYPCNGLRWRLTRGGLRRPWRRRRALSHWLSQYSEWSAS